MNINLHNSAPSQIENLYKIKDKRGLSFYIFMSLSIPFLGFILGVCIGIFSPSSFHLDDLQPNSASTSASSFALNNGTLGLSLFVLGAATYGIASSALLALNGYIIGQLLLALAHGGRLDAALTGLLPHALFEVAGLAAMSGAGILLLHAIIRVAIGPRDEISAKMPLLAMVLGAAGLTAIALAALIESNLSTIPSLN